MHARRTSIGLLCMALSCIGALESAGCTASPARKALESTEPVPPDPEAITVFGRYQPSLESLAPQGVLLGDLAVVEGRLVIQLQAESDSAGDVFARSLRRSGWYREARWEAVPADAREGERVLSVRPSR